MNFAMWKKALNIIPSVTKEEWDKLDLVSKWLISTRAAVLIMTFLSAALAGLFALRDGAFQFLPWLVMALGLILAHATNNLFNDYTDFKKGVDKDNYFRTQYGPQPVADGLMTTTQLLTYTAVTGAIATALGILLIAYNGWDRNIMILLGLGAFFVISHMAAQVYCFGGISRTHRLGTFNDRWRVLCPGWDMGLECCMGEPSLCIWCDHRHIW
jgi:1,4-dihydroxy-2-naphthoate octaprenyltransferase